MFNAVNKAIFPFPEAPNPMVLLLFVQLKILLEVLLVNTTGFVCVPLQII